MYDERQIVQSITDKHNSAVELEEDLVKNLLPLTATLLVFWGAVGIFFINSATYLFHPKWVWISLFSSLVTGVSYHAIKIHRIYKQTKAICDVGEDSGYMYTNPLSGMTEPGYPPYKIERVLRNLQIVCFLLGILLSGVLLWNTEMNEDSSPPHALQHQQTPVKQLPKS